MYMKFINTEVRLHSCCYYRWRLCDSSRMIWKPTVLVLYCVFTSIEGVSYFGSDRQYVCHCKEDRYCNNKGKCLRGACAAGWMGPGCQYVNTALGQKAYVDEARRVVIVDGDMATGTPWSKASSKFSISVQLNSPHWITWVQVKIFSRKPSAVSELVVTLQTSSDRFEICGGSSNSRVLDHARLYNVFCDTPILATRVLANVTLSNAGYTEVHEILISGGLNVAIQKPSDQSSTSSYGRYHNASLAVDGRTSSCSKTNIEDHPTWTLNLQNIYRPRFIRIFKRKGNNDLLGGFLIHIQRQSASEWIGRLVNDTRNTAPAPVITIPFDQIIDLKAVRISLPRKGKLTLCEVQVFADCPDDTFGFDCSGTCHCDGGSDNCNKVFGSCKNGCEPGFTGDTCSEACIDGSFGMNCSYDCRCLDNSEVCNKATGSCLSGCAAGYTGPGCQDECDVMRYGPNCAGRCSENCKHRQGRTCELLDGTCIDGCQPGWQSNTCTQPCSEGRYGRGCNNSCGAGCEVGSCNKEDGSCVCLAGWTGPQCDTECNDGSFGVMCSYQCRCQNNSNVCNKTTGSCQSGCAAGHIGPGCQYECSVMSYGLDCTGRCSESCNNNGGHRTCGLTDGKCISGCLPGWMTDTCTQPCSEGRYGRGCNNSCGAGCEGGSCKKEDGSCVCLAGWTGPQCDTACIGGWFGMNCSYHCRCQDNSEVCNKATGSCQSGCAAGYTGPDCQEESVLESQTASNVGLPVGITLGICVFVITLSAILIIYQRRLILSARNAKERSTPRDEHIDLFPMVGTEPSTDPTPHEYEALEDTYEQLDAYQNTGRSSDAQQHSLGESWSIDWMSS